MPRKVLLDTDPGSDDAVMMAMALGADDIEVIGVTTVAGNTTVGNTTDNALRVLELLDRTDIPVARGAEGPMLGEVTPAEWVHGPDGMRGELPAPVSGPVDRHAVDFIIDQVDRFGDEVTIVSVGPMTNLATALICDPSIPDRAGDIYLMGGAAMTTGNTTPMAEANVHNDPVAAKKVLTTARPHMVGLDATNHATIPPDIIEEYLTSPAPLDTIGSWLNYPPRVREFGPGEGPAIHDAAVVAHLLDDVLTFESYFVDVDTTAGPCRGAVVCDRYGVLEEEPNVDVAVDIDTDGFRSALRRSVESLP